MKKQQDERKHAQDDGQRVKEDPTAETAQLQAHEVAANSDYEEFPEGAYGMSLPTQRLGKTDDEIRKEIETDPMK